MNNCAMQQNAFAACEERRGAFSFAVADRRPPPVFCPKPRRLGPLFSADSVLPLQWHASHQGDLSDTKAGEELLDLFLTKGGEQAASSPPFFCGSPPSRAANPVVQDARFGEDRPPAPIAVLPVQSGSPMSPRKGCVRAKFGLKPPAVRIEGFDCLNRDSRSCSITAVA